MFELEKYEAMAMLDLPENERRHLTARAEEITASFKELDAMSTDGVQPLSSVLHLHNILREDDAIKQFTRDEVLANAPDQHDGFFRVPGTL